jgi:Tol biopolymer transport system component
MKLRRRSRIWWLGAAVATAWLALGTGIAYTRIAAEAQAGTRPPTTAESIAYSRCTVKQGISCTATALFSTAADGSHRRLLVPDASNPAWSPDGRQIAYSSSRGGIWIARADGSSRRRLTAPPHRDGALDNEPGWSPDGSRVAFHREWYGNGNPAPIIVDLYAVEVRTGRVTRLTQTPKIPEFEPAWSPDGMQVAYNSGERGSEKDGIYVLDLASGRSKRLTSGFHAKPDWSPDGTKIAFAVVGGAGPGAIVVMKRDGSRRRKVVASAGPWRWFGAPSWSPDGSRIAYDWAVGEGPHRIVVVRADGKGRRLVVRNGESPDWRPHGPTSARGR